MAFLFKNQWFYGRTFSSLTIRSLFTSFHDSSNICFGNRLILRADFFINPWRLATSLFCLMALLFKNRWFSGQTFSSLAIRSLSPSWLFFALSNVFTFNKTSILTINWVVIPKPSAARVSIRHFTLSAVNCHHPANVLSSNTSFTASACRCSTHWMCHLYAFNFSLLINHEASTSSKSIFVVHHLNYFRIGFCVRGSGGSGKMTRCNHIPLYDNPPLLPSMILEWTFILLVGWLLFTCFDTPFGILPVASRCFKPPLPSCLHAFVHPCLRASLPSCIRAFVPHCLCAPIAFMPLSHSCPHCLRASVPSCLHCLHASLPSCTDDLGCQRHIVVRPYSIATFWPTT